MASFMTSQPLDLYLKSHLHCKINEVVKFIVISDQYYQLIKSVLAGSTPSSTLLVSLSSYRM
jgi:hypothetical protein